jgi:hypothetical protein
MLVRLLLPASATSQSTRQPEEFDCHRRQQCHLPKTNPAAAADVHLRMMFDCKAPPLF